MKTVREIMNASLNFCSPTDNIEVVASWMSISSVAFLPVLNTQAHVIGTITYSEICKAIKENNLSGNTDIKVSQVMNYKPVFIHSYDDEASAFKKMRLHHINYLPVIDDECHLKGVVSFMAIARRMIGIKKKLRAERSGFYGPDSLIFKTAQPEKAAAFRVLSAS